MVFEEHIDLIFSSFDTKNLFLTHPLTEEERIKLSKKNLMRSRLFFELLCYTKPFLMLLIFDKVDYLYPVKNCP
jgi:hypothetical protein